ncbi:hypothetical protein TcCL_ESM08832 [Trypanosoma cruzi]|nr:hypothetical protein TcCL_ESM08832 [Trypanosoma cruzi]
MFSDPTAAYALPTSSNNSLTSGNDGDQTPQRLRPSKAARTPSLLSRTHPPTTDAFALSSVLPPTISAHSCRSSARHRETKHSNAPPSEPLRTGTSYDECDVQPQIRRSVPPP